ncbi:hypothetical protein D3C76_1138510 [compost metagenome]
MRKNNCLYRVTGKLVKDEVIFHVDVWGLLITTNRYYEIKPPVGAVKRIYKEKLNLIVDDTKYYVNGVLSCSAFCTEEVIEDVQKNILQKLYYQVDTYMNDLKLNLQAIDHHHLFTKNR